MLTPPSIARRSFLKSSSTLAAGTLLAPLLGAQSGDAKSKLIVYDALPSGGAFIAVEALIDDARRENTFGLLMSLNMLIEVGEAFDYSGAGFRGWCTEAGFTRFEVIHLAGPASAAIAYKK